MAALRRIAMNHPQAAGSGNVCPTDLLAYLEGEPQDQDARRVGALVAELRAQGVAEDSPTFVDVSDGLDRTVGIAIVVPSADESEGQAEALAEVERAVAALESFTSSTNDAFAWELAGEVIGWVQAGVRDESLELGLLAPWRERLQGS